MSDDAPDPEELDLADWPDARKAYHLAWELMRLTFPLLCCLGHAPALAGPSARQEAAWRELTRIMRRLSDGELDPAAKAWIRRAIELGYADGRAWAEPRW
jgi:hypothetical protein